MTGEEAYWAGIGPEDFRDDEVNPDDPQGILLADRDAEIEAQIESWPCNDCGLPCLKGDELCGTCYEKEQREKEWELMHPELRCPPRE
jgi:hypothetical protein